MELAFSLLKARLLGNTPTGVFILVLDKQISNRGACNLVLHDLAFRYTASNVIVVFVYGF